MSTDYHKQHVFLQELVTSCSRHLCSGSKRCVIRSNGATYCTQSEERVNQWRPIYETDDTGGVVSGRKHDLISAFKSASIVRVYVPSWNQTFNLGFTFVHASKNISCSQSLFQIAKKSWNIFSEKITRVIYMFCESGYYQKHHLGSVDGPINPDEFGLIGMKWFTRYYCQHLERFPIYCHNKEGQTTCGSFPKLESDILHGAEVRIFAGNHIYCQVLEQIVVKYDVVAAQFQRRVSSISNLASNTTLSRKFVQSDPFWVYGIYSSDGTYNKMKSFIGKDAQSTEIKEKKVDWYTDMCWSAVYSHSNNGDSLSGSKNKLRASIMAGKIVRIVYNNVVAGEPDSLFVDTDGHVTAQLLNQISILPPSYFHSNAYWYWLMISSRGFQNILRIYLGSYAFKSTDNRITRVRWYANTRPWRKLLMVSSSGSIITGSKHELRGSLESGGMLRLVLTFPNRTVLAFSPDNIEYHGGEVSAQFVRHVGHVQKSGSKGRVFPTAPYWNFIMVTTEGTLTSSLCDVRTNYQLSTESVSVATTWFVN
ncbi:uncharacterized protein LOC117331101 [Pecten maximus]|uniref:uncharacterized protein LOC117331101 n=1 Tax=Pecten maximus TaxID=6579 RepID=UPI00145863BD|nr:uncharacterized protein LOC117331101 [Pecten maximus]